MTSDNELTAVAQRVVKLLREHHLRLVLAESCTGGLIATTLTAIPGVSEYFCGSAVVYRIATKQSWLDVSREHLHRPGPVSREVAAEMADGALRRTPEADVAAAVTGHLGPDAPPEEDGLIFVAVAGRSAPPVVEEHWLHGDGEDERGHESLRIRRRRSAAHKVLEAVRNWLGQHGGAGSK